MFSRLISYLSIALCSFYLTACSGPETAQDVSVTFVRSAYTADVKKTLDCIDDILKSNGFEEIEVTTCNGHKY